MTGPDREPFAGVTEWIAERMTPHGLPAEITPLSIGSIGGVAQVFTDELHDPLLKEPLISLLHDYQNNPTVEGVGLVAVAGYHLSIRVLTDLSGKGEQWQRDQKAMLGGYDAFAQSLYDAIDADVTPRPRPIGWSLSFYNTAGQPASTLVPGILEKMSREVDASVVTFITFEKTTAPLA